MDNATRILKKNQMEILNLKNTIIEIQNSIEQLNHRLDIAEEKNELEDKSVDTSQKEVWKTGFIKSIKETWDTEKRSNIHVIGATEERRERTT